MIKETVPNPEYSADPVLAAAAVPLCKLKICQ